MQPILQLLLPPTPQNKHTYRESQTINRSNIPICNIRQLQANQIQIRRRRTTAAIRQSAPTPINMPGSLPTNMKSYLTALFLAMAHF